PRLVGARSRVDGQVAQARNRNAGQDSAVEAATTRLIYSTVVPSRGPNECAACSRGTLCDWPGAAAARVALPSLVCVRGPSTTLTTAPVTATTGTVFMGPHPSPVFCGVSA
ncbi:MAG: hypothetical protein ACRDTJ_07790, partial [Pseudonocardiaceae bacterium]